MNLDAKEVKMLKHLLAICYEDKIDMYLDDIKTFNSLRHRINAKNPLKNDSERPVVQPKVGRSDQLKSDARKFWNRRNRHKTKQGMKDRHD